MLTNTVKPLGRLSFRCSHNQNLDIAPADGIQVFVLAIPVIIPYTSAAPSPSTTIPITSYPARPYQSLLIIASHRQQ